MRKFISLSTLGLAMVLVLFTACNKDKGEGSMRVRMTDDPGDYLQVNVDVREVEVHYDNGNGWVSLPTNDSIYNLLDLQNNVNVILAPTSQMPVGNVSQMRLKLGPNNSIMLNDSTTLPLTVPSGEQSGLKININQYIAANSTVDILLDFDAGKSILLTGNGEYKLKPVIHVDDVIIQ